MLLKKEFYSKLVHLTWKIMIIISTL